MVPNVYDNPMGFSSSDIDSTTTYGRLRSQMSYSECSSSVSRLQVSNMRKKSQRRRKPRVQPVSFQLKCYHIFNCSTLFIVSGKLEINSFDPLFFVLWFLRQIRPRLRILTLPISSYCPKSMRVKIKNEENDFV